MQTTPLTCQQSTDEGNPFDVGVAIFAAEPQAFGQVGAHDVAIQDLHVAPCRFQTVFKRFRERTLAGA